MLKNLYDANPEDGGSSVPLSNDANAGSSSTQTEDANAQPEGEPTEDAPEGEDEDVEDTSTDDTGDESDRPNTLEKEEAVNEPPPLADKPEDAKLEFHKHPRFQELIREKNESRTELESLKPKAERADIIDTYLHTHGIQPQEFTRALEYLRLYRTDPAQAWNIIKGDVDLLRQATGESLPPDLEAKVAAGSLDPDIARELTKARAASTRQNQTNAHTEQFAAQQHESLINSANAAWGSMKAQVDPAFRPKSTEAHPDGMWELVNAKVLQLRSQNPPRDTREAHKQCQTAYESVQKSLSQFTPKKPVTRRPIGSTNSSTNSNPVIKSSEDVVKAIMSGKRPIDLRYS